MKAPGRGHAEAAATLACVFVGLLWITVTALMISGILFRSLPHNIDYSVLWTGTRVAVSAPRMLYDIEHVTQLQLWLIDFGPRPFIYPPSALPLFLPFSLLPFWMSYFVWMAVSMLCFAAASRRLVRGWPLLLTMVSVPVVKTAYTGQTSLILGAAAIFGMVLGRSRPLVGAFILGLAAAVKPQLFVLAPILLWGDPKRLASLIAGGAAMVCASLPFGPSLWPDWFHSLPRFAVLVDSMGIMPSGVSPRSTAAWLAYHDFGSPPAWLLQAAGVVSGVSLGIWSRRGDDCTRVFGLVAGGILCSPYAMYYDLAPLMPVLAASLFSGRLIATVQGLPGIFVAAAVTFPLAVVAFVWDRRSAPLQPAVRQQE